MLVGTDITAGRTGKGVRWRCAGLNKSLSWAGSSTEDDSKSCCFLGIYHVPVGTQLFHILLHLILSTFL